MTHDIRATPATAVPHIRKSCYTCELEEKIATLEAEAQKLREERDALKKRPKIETMQRIEEENRRLHRLLEVNGIHEACGKIKSMTPIILCVCRREEKGGE